MSELARPTIHESLISARLSLLQSRRMLLAAAERRFQKDHSLRTRVDHMRHEADDANEKYSSSMLRWGSPDAPQYWSVAYGRLADRADALSRKLRSVVDDLPADERYAMATDVEMLELLVDRWRESIRAQITAVA